MSELYDLFLKHPRISTDTRKIEPDSIFFALRGANFDGNRFVAEALEKGAAFAVSDDAGARPPTNASSMPGTRCKPFRSWPGNTAGR